MSHKNFRDIISTCDGNLWRIPSDKWGKTKNIQMNAIGNLIRLICGGFFAALGYFITGFVFCITIIGIPFGIQCFKIGMLELLPFGKELSQNLRQAVV